MDFRKRYNHVDTIQIQQEKLGEGKAGCKSQESSFEDEENSS
ncbi:hypothetical protein [Bacillus cereus]